MTKIVDYIKAHLINTLGIIAVVFCLYLCFLRGRGYSIGYFYTSIITYIYYFSPIGFAAVLLICFLANIAAFIMVKKDSPFDIIVLSVLFGSLGAFIGILFNREYKYTKVVKIIFKIQAWLFVCIAIPIFIYWFDSPFLFYSF